MTRAPLRRSHLRIPVAILLIAGVTGAGLFTWLARSDLESSDIVASGRGIYAQYCASCHGANLEGQPDWRSPVPSGRLPAPPHDASGHTWHHSDQDLFTIVRDGFGTFAPNYETDMPEFAGVLTDEEVRSVLEFIKSTWPRREREVQAGRTAAELAQQRETPAR